MCRSAVSIVVLAAVACLTSADAAGIQTGLTPTERATVLGQYMPVLYFHEEEKWSPVRVEQFLNRARVERQEPRGVWSAAPPGIPTSSAGCTAQPCYRFNLPCPLKSGVRCYERTAPAVTDWKRGVVYGRVVDVPDGTPEPAGIPEPTRYLVRYWLFYVFDDWHARRDTLWQAHEGDWETISVGLAADLHPTFAAYSQHCSGSVRPWTRLQRRGSHPVAYVALGSHANYFEKTSSPTQFLHCVYRNISKTNLSKARRIVGAVQGAITDRTGAAHLLGPAGGAGAPLELVQLPTPLPTWARFPGKWSEGQLLWAGRTPTRFSSVAAGGGPATPRWTASRISALWHSESG